MNSQSLSHDARTSINQLIEQTEVFPKPHRETNYWHTHLSLGSKIIGFENARFEVRQLYIQTLIDRTHHLATIAPIGTERIRVVAAITLPDLRDSQIIVFFGSDYFRDFFARNAKPIHRLKSEDASLAKELNLRLPKDFSERGFQDNTYDNNCDNNGHDEQIWFFGQLSEEC